MTETVPIVGAVLRNGQGQYLLVQERKPHIYGLWNWPAGHVDAGETDSDAAVREVKEETNLDVRIVDLEPVYEAPGDVGTNHWVRLFVGEVIGGVLQFQREELLDARWFGRDEIATLDNNGQTRGGQVMGAITTLENRLAA